MLLEGITSPQDIKKFNVEQLNALAKEIRERIVEVVSKNGGHLAPNLGAVELIIALHYCFNSPKDKLIFDVGHQAYAHKLLTGRNKSFDSLRKFNGISGYLEREESIHDIFGAGHTSTSVSAASGFAAARDLKKEDYHVVALIGDGALTAGMAFEALNFIGHQQQRVIVIVNDNKMSISPNVGALEKHLERLSSIAVKGKRVDIETIFHKMGFSYIGPLDGHNIEELIDAFEEAKKSKRPIIVHARTKKGKGLSDAESDPVSFHGVGPLNKKKKSSGGFSNAFVEALIELAEKDEEIVAITAAMATGTKLIKFAEKFPERFFDVGIAEQHAVTFAAGLAANGMKPCAAIYSTFLQRAFDQIEHDVCLQNLPVKFFVDRAGLVGEDGATHNGVFDLSYLGMLPNIVVAAAKDELELKDFVKTAIEYNEGPFAVRYPRGNFLQNYEDKKLETIEIGKSETLRKGDDVTIFALGPVVYEAEKAAKLLEKEGISVGVINARFAKPIDRDALIEAAERTKILTIEENNIANGFSANVALLLAEEQIETKLTALAIPDAFIRHASRAEQLEMLGFSDENIARIAKSLAKNEKTGVWPKDFDKIVRKYNNIGNPAKNGFNAGMH